MKKLLLPLLLAFGFHASMAQAPTTIPALQTKVNSDIVTNGTKSITAKQLNDILNGIINLMTTQSVDSCYRINDTLFFTRIGKATLKVVLNTGGTSSETDPTVPSVAKSLTGTDTARWNGKQDKLTAGSAITVIDGFISAQNTLAQWNAYQIQGRSISPSAPAFGQVLKWNGTNWAPADDGGGSGTVPYQRIPFGNPSDQSVSSNSFIYDSISRAISVGNSISGTYKAPGDMYVSVPGTSNFIDFKVNDVDKFAVTNATTDVYNQLHLYDVADSDTTGHKQLIISSAGRVRKAPFPLAGNSTLQQVTDNGNTTNKYIGIKVSTALLPLHVNADSVALESSNAGPQFGAYRIGTPTSGNRLGSYVFGAKSPGNAFNMGAEVVGFAEGTWNHGVSHPTYLTFRTVPSGSTGSVEAMRINSQGWIGIGFNSPTGLLHIAGASADRVSLVLQNSLADPASPTNGGIWHRNNHIWARLNGLNYQLDQQVLSLTDIPTRNFSDINGKPTTLSGYGITDPVALTSGSYANPAWITSLAWSKLTGSPIASAPAATIFGNKTGSTGTPSFMTGAELAAIMPAQDLTIGGSIDRTTATDGSDSLHLEGDEVNPGANKVYGTNGSGQKVWKNDPAGSGAGDVTSNTTTSVDGELAVFNGTTGKQIKRSTLTGIPLLTSGVPSALSTTGTGGVVRETSPTIVTPTIANLTFMQHSHANAAAGGQIAESALNLTDNTTMNATTSRHGFLPKLTNDANQFLNGQGIFATPPGGGVTDGDKGDLTITGGVWNLDNSVVTFAKMANIPTLSLIGRYSTGSGVPQNITLGAGLSLNTSTGELSATGGGSGLGDPGANGMVARTSSGATTSRTLTGTTNLITVTNGDGVSGNPTFTVGSNVVQKTATLTAGSVPFVQSGGTLTEDNNAFFFDNTNKRLYINQSGSSPAVTAAFSKTDGTFNPVMQIADNLTNGYTMYRYRGTGRDITTGVGNATESTFGVANKYFIFDETGNAMRLVINTTGQVGIGTANPSSLLHVNGAPRFDIGSDATGDLLTRSSGGALQRIAAVASGSVLKSNGVGAVPIYGKVTLTSGTDVSGALPIANGGHGQTTATAGFNALAPSQTGNGGKVLTTDGTNTSWTTTPVSNASSYVPSLFDVTNTSSSIVGHTAYTCTYYTVIAGGSTYYHIDGAIDVGCLASNTFTEIDMSTPVASNLINGYDVYGEGSFVTAIGTGDYDSKAITVNANITNDRIRLQFRPGAGNGTNFSHRLQFHAVMKYTAP